MTATKLWYPHYIEKYRRKTGHLTLAEHGAYRLLMDWYWDRRGPLPAKEDRLRRYLRADCREWKKIREAILEFFVLTEDGYRHEMIDETLAEAERQYEAKSGRIAKAREAKAAKRSSDNSSDDRSDYSDDDRADDKPEINSDSGTPSPSSSHSPNGEPRGVCRARARATAQSVSVLRETSVGNIPPTAEHSPDVGAILDAWSAMAVDIGWADGYLAPTCSPGDLRQIAHLAARYGPEAWPKVIENIRGSPFYRGEEGHWSGASLSWVLEEKNFVKVHRNDHGKREKRASNGAGKAPRVADFVRELRISQEKPDDAGREPVYGVQPLAR